MALRAGTIIERARYAHPAFDRAVIPATVAAQFVNEAQRRLLVATHERNAAYLVRRWVIALLPGQNIAQVGAGTNVGAPLVEGTVALERRTVPTGSGATMDDPPTVLVGERAVTSAAAGSLSDTTAAWTVNAWMGQAVEIIAGTGAGQVREIASNLANTLFLDPTTPWETIPDPTSTYRIVVNQEAVTGQVGVAVGEQPSVAQTPSWLVKLDAQGQPYLDLSAPIQVPMTVGIPLPPCYYVNHGLVRFDNDAAYPGGSRTLTISTLDAQVAPPTMFSAAVVGQTLQLFRPFEQWRDVRFLELPYCPLAPAVSGADDLLLLPEPAEDALIARVAYRMGNRAKAMQRLGDAGVLAELRDEMQTTEDLYLGSVAGAGRATVGSIVEVW